ncbi:hypothetical protein ACF1G0_34665 [Streptomyces sp. NPDC013953]|uniref:hypothetical protein n=1 Tax=Streptomyces sp. NPDC013953 TaxID=3364868 RepID=UPI0036F8AD3B
MSPAPNLPDEGLAIGDQPSPPAADTGHLHQLYRSLRRAESHERSFLSFPEHLGQVVSELAPLLGRFVDHRKDPYSGNLFDAGTQEYEEAVLEYFAALAGA